MKLPFRARYPGTDMKLVRRRLAQASLAGGLLLAAGVASACASGMNVITNQTVPGSRASGSLTFEGCPAPATPAEARVILHGLSFHSSWGGSTRYTIDVLGDDSPELSFSLYGDATYDLDESWKSSSLKPYAPNGGIAYTSVHVGARGSFPAFYGKVASIQVKQISSGEIRTSDVYLRIDPTRVPTCSFSAGAVTLPDIRPSDLPNAGSHAGETPLGIQLLCDRDGHADVKHSITVVDANDPASFESTLKPSAGSNASGVRIEVLYDNTPITLRAGYDAGRIYRSQTPALSARYRRDSGTFVPGSIGGRITVLVNYQ